MTPIDETIADDLATELEIYAHVRKWFDHQTERTRGRFLNYFTDLSHCITIEDFNNEKR